MRLPLRRIGVIAGIILLLLITTGAILRLTVEPEIFKPQMASLVRKLTGLEPRFEGDVALDLLPFGLRFEDVSLSVPGGPAGPDGKPLLRLDSIAIEASLLALVNKNIKASALHLKGLECNLLRNAQGELNLPHPPIKEVEAQEEHVKVVTRDDETLLFSYDIHDLSLEEGRFLYVDEVLGTRYLVDDIALEASSITPRDSFPVTFTCHLSASDPDLSGGLSMRGDVLANPLSRVLAVQGYELSAELQGPDLAYDAATFALSGNARLDAQAKQFTLGDLLASISAEGGPFSGEQGLEVSWPEAALDLAGGGLTAAPLSLSGPEFKARLDLSGQNMTTAPVLNAVLKVPSFSPRKVLAALEIIQADALQQALPDDEALATSELEADIVVDADSTEIQECTFNLDDAVVRLQGAWTHASRSGEFELHCNDLDLDRYLPLLGAQADESKSTKADAPAKAEATASRGSESLLPNLLRDVSLQAEVHLRNIHAAGLAYPRTDGTVSLKKGHLRSDMELGSFYDGHVQSSITAGLDQNPPTLTCDSTLRGVQLEPLLQDIRGSAPLTGTADLTARLEARGLGLPQILPSLQGEVSFTTVKGLVYGFSVSGASGNTEGGSTRFEKISASGPVRDGVVHLKRIYASLPPHTAKGSGRVNLVRETLDLQLTADFLNFAGIPVTVRGPWRDPAVSVNAQGGLEVIGEILSAPKEAGEALGTALGEGLGELLDGFAK